MASQIRPQNRLKGMPKFPGTLLCAVRCQADRVVLASDPIRNIAQGGASHFGYL